MPSDAGSLAAAAAYRRAQVRLRLYDAKLAIMAVIDAAEFRDALTQAQVRRLLESAGALQSLIHELGR